MMGVGMTASQKDRARNLFANGTSGGHGIEGLSFDLADAENQNQSTDFTEEYHATLMAYYQHFRCRLQIVKHRARIVKGC